MEIDRYRQFYLMHSYIPMNNIILVTWIIEGLDNRGPDNRGSTVMNKLAGILSAHVLPAEHIANTGSEVNDSCL